MKLLKITLLSVASLLFIIIVAVTIFISRFDINSYLDPIKQQASQALGRPVTIDHAKLDLNFIKGLSLAVEGVTVADDEKFSRNDFLHITTISAAVDVMAFLIKREIVVTTVSVEGLKLTIIRDDKGNINAQTLGVKPNPSSVSTSNPPSSSAVSSAPAAAIPPFVIKQLVVNGGEIQVIDKNPQMPMDLRINQINVTLDQFSLNQPFGLTLQCAVFSKAPDVLLKSQITLDLSNQAAALVQTTLNVNLNAIQLSALAESLPGLPSQSFPTSMEGNLSVSLDPVNVSPKGLDGLNASINLAQGSVKMAALPVPLTAINSQMKAGLTQLDISSLTANVGKGTFSAKGTVANYLATPAYSIDFQAKALRANELVDATVLPVVINAAINAEGKIAGVSLSPTEALVSLNGNINVDVTQGKIEKFNLANNVLVKLGNLPIIGPALSEILKNGLDNTLNSETTTLNGAQLKAVFANGEMTIDPLMIDTQPAIINGKGKVQFPAIDVNVSADTTLNKDISDRLIKSLKPLRGLVDEKGLILIPGNIAGVAPKIGYSPDVNYITKRISVSETSEVVGKQLDKVLEKNPEVRSILNAVLGGGSTQEDAPTAPVDENSQTGQQPTTDQQQPTQESGKDYINNILKRVIK